MTTLDELQRWLTQKEDNSLECKEAKNGFDEGELMEYCAAMANEKGGVFILGVERGHQITGTTAFLETLEKLQHELLQQLRLRVEIEELQDPNGRVLIFHIPRHCPRTPVKYKGRYWMRVGPVKKEMDAETLRKICNEYEDDYSAGIVPDLEITDLDERAITILKERRARREGRPELAVAPTEQTLRDLELLTENGLTYAALILLGKKEKIATHLPQAEIIFEWRGNPGKISYDFRREWKEPYMVALNEIWDMISARNIRTPFQQGFAVPLEIPAFDENSCREAINNAITHREYRRPGAIVFIRCSPLSFSVVSPGGFPEGVTSENALERSIRRNPRIAETLQHTGLVERSGQGLDRIFEQSIRQGKGKPDFSGTDEFEVHLNIPAQVRDPTFVQYLERVANERQITFSFEELLELEHIRTQGSVSSPAYRENFLDLKLIEQVGRTKNARYVLSRSYYEHIGRKGSHTREMGLSRDAKKQLILEHLQRHGRVRRNELQDAFLGTPSQILSNILQELRNKGSIVFFGSRRNGYWAHNKSNITISNSETNDEFIGSKKPN
ncbi:MAG: ATP-binding protein [Candidatus Peribacteraceae bacterium]|nr:ATP-binding protein [Candidatus Peribacteraceae bacterium]